MPPLPRLGFHYFPDTLHYREADLTAWLPELRALGASWLTLIAPSDRAIPESFLRGLLAAGIQPVLHFHLPLGLPSQAGNLRPLFEAYARWGVRYVALFDRPNSRAAWPASHWAQQNLVERFLDLFLPLAGAALQAGLAPVFPPLEPGGDYWDTAFLRAALQGTQRRGHPQLLAKLILGAYAWAGNRPLDWGAGGPERWPNARPYRTLPGEQDQRGFRIFDWYLTLARTVQREPAGVILLAAGSRPGDRPDPEAPAIDSASHARRSLAIARLVASPSPAHEPPPFDPPPFDTGEATEPVPSEVLACCFWLLAASPESPPLPHAWFQPDGATLPAVSALRQWVASQPSNTQHATRNPALSEVEGTPYAIRNTSSHPITHYLLLPSYEWGVADWHLEVIRPFVKKYRPTVGFSLDEAAHAARVTVIGGSQSFPDAAVERLEAAGCVVERISGTGTEIATILASL